MAFDLQIASDRCHKINRMQNQDLRHFTRKDLWACAGYRIYAIMLPSSDFSVAH